MPAQEEHLRSKTVTSMLEHSAWCPFEATRLCVNCQCIYQAPGGELCLLGVYVDNIVLAAQTTGKIREVKRGLEQKFAIKSIGRLHSFFWA